ncbi:hypothetical protein [Streptomyces sp. x-19]|uniref:hypothetical protein n=1 Tax=Streptomyces sp. x-19 TaxID=2789280 RepID=UPI00397FE970
MSAIARLFERHAFKVLWIIVLGGAASVFVGDPMWRWVAGLGPGAGYAFGAFCGSGILCWWPLADAALKRRQRARCIGAMALGCVAFLALSCVVPTRHGRLFGSIAMASDQRMWVEENPAAWAAIGIGFALGALALWYATSRRTAGLRRRSRAIKG